MNITVNNEAREFAASPGLSDIVYHLLGDKQNGIAVAVNNRVIPKAERQGYLLQDGDQVLIIKATQGG